MNRNTSITEINFPTRVKRAIERAQQSGKTFKTAGDLMDAKDEDFRGIHFFGTGTIRAMREHLNGSNDNQNNNSQSNGNQGGNNAGQQADRGPDGKVLDGRRNNGGQNRGQTQNADGTFTGGDNSNDNQDGMQEIELAAQADEGGILNWAKGHANLIGAIIRGEIELIPSRK